MAVEKLLPAKFAKIKLRQDALQTTFLVFLDIFYPPIFGCFEENGLFQDPQASTRFDPKTGEARSMSVMGMLQQLSDFSADWEKPQVAVSRFMCLDKGCF